MLSNTPIKAIRAKCLDCCVGSPKEVQLCEISDCALYPFRMGKNPFTRNKGNIRNFQFGDRGAISTSDTERSEKNSPKLGPEISKESILEGGLE